MAACFLYTSGIPIPKNCFLERKKVEMRIGKLSRVAAKFAVFPFRERRKSRNLFCFHKTFREISLRFLQGRGKAIMYEILKFTFLIFRPFTSHLGLCKEFSPGFRFRIFKRDLLYKKVDENLHIFRQRREFSL